MMLILPIRVFVVSNSESTVFLRNVAQCWGPCNSWAAQTVNRVPSLVITALLLSNLALSLNFLLSTFQGEVPKSLDPLSRSQDCIY